MQSKLLSKAWQRLEQAVVEYEGKAVGTVAAIQPGAEAINYDHVFTRDFAVSALAYLMQGRHEMVRHFLQVLVELQNRKKEMDCFKPGEGLMPASFKVEKRDDGDVLLPDYGEKAIARVAPVDSVFWWLFILRAYVKAGGDTEFAKSEACQRAIRYIIELALTARFDMFPTLLAPDGSFMIDRRMGVYGYPFDLQSLFFTALRAAQELLQPEEENQPYIAAVEERLGHLVYHIRNYYWLDFGRLNEIYRYKVEQFGSTALNKFNIYPETIPDWIYDWLPDTCGYFIGNLGPARIDFRFFTSGNLMSILGCLADSSQSRAILSLINQRWDELVGAMPIKLCYPAISGRDWHVVTGSDPKNVPWSYHNGGSWPFLNWMLTAAAVKLDQPEMAKRALAIAEKRLEQDEWPEYYDGKHNRLLGKEARKYQTWTIAGYIVATMLLDEPKHMKLLSFDSEPDVSACSTAPYEIT